MIAIVDGVLSAAADARLSALDRAAWYGDAAFETFAVRGRRVLALAPRLARLRSSLARLGVAFDDEPRIVRELGRALDAFGPADAYVRVAVSRGVGQGGLLPTPSSPVLTIVVLPLPAFPARLVTEGLRVTSLASGDRVHARAGGAKIASYVEPMLALVEARARGLDDGIVLDREGIVLEGTTSSVFAWDGSAWTTPPLSLGILPGITRQLCLGLLREVGVPVREAILGIHDLYRASEIVLTSSLRGVVPVTVLDGRPVSRGLPGPAFTALAASYLAFEASHARAVDDPADSR